MVNMMHVEPKKHEHIWRLHSIGKMLVPLGWGPLNNQPHIHLKNSGYLLDISPFKGLLRGVKQLVYHPKGTTIFPMILWRMNSGHITF